MSLLDLPLREPLRVSLPQHPDLILKLVLMNCWKIWSAKIWTNLSSLIFTMLRSMEQRIVVIFPNQKQHHYEIYPEGCRPAPWLFPWWQWCSQFMQVPGQWHGLHTVATLVLVPGGEDHVGHDHGQHSLIQGNLANISVNPTKVVRFIGFPIS